MSQTNLNDIPNANTAAIGMVQSQRVEAQMTASDLMRRNQIAVNPAGINPTEFKVLVEPKPVEQKIGSIILPETTKESEKYATTEGRIVAISHLAFTYATPDEWAGQKPKAGDAILYAKYAGVRVKGKDGKEYLLVNDKDICATIEE